MFEDDPSASAAALGLLRRAERALDEDGPERAIDLAADAVARLRPLAAAGHRADLIHALVTHAVAASQLDRDAEARDGVFEAAALAAGLSAPLAPERSVRLAMACADLAEAGDDIDDSIALYRVAAEHMVGGEAFVLHHRAHLLWRLSDLLAERHGSAAAVEATRAAVEALRAVPGPLRQLEEDALPLADALVDLAIRLEHAPEAAVTAAEEAVALYGARAADDLDGWRFDLARGLFVASVYHGALGRRPRALETIEQAVELIRGADPDARWAARPLLAHCLHNLGLWTQPIRPRAAEPALRESIALYRQLEAEAPGEFADDVATSLASLASLLAVHRHRSEAARVNDEAVARLRVLADRGVEHMDGALADALIIAGSLAVSRGDLADAARTWDEGIDRIWPAFEAAPDERGYTTALLLGCRMRLSAADPRHRRDLSRYVHRFNALQWPEGAGLVRQGRYTLDGPR